METVNNFMEEHFRAPIQSNGHSKDVIFLKVYFRNLELDDCKQ